ncbi:MAG: hypothetical protein HYU77_13725 [Betaproteobacteria bacterium]|nr:hypothetical protein [Betaproteobacteria bacterium]
MNDDFAILYTSIQDAASSLSCDRANGGRLWTVARLRSAIAEEERGANRSSMITLLRREMRRREGK